MSFMLFFVLGVDQNIIDKKNYKLVQIFLKNMFIKCINAAGALVNPKDITKNS